MNFDLDALTSSASGMLKLPLFLALFLVVRGTPALLLYRGVLAARERLALAFFSATELPLVVAITTVAIETGHMKSSTAAGLVGAAILSALVYPLIGLRLRRGGRAQPMGRSSPRRLPPDQSTSWSSFGSPLRLRWPSAVTTTRSSIRTPKRPGR